MATASVSPCVSQDLLERCMSLLHLEHDIATLKNKLKAMNRKKKDAVNSVMGEMRVRNLDKVRTDIGTVNIKEAKKKEAITASFLKNALINIYKNEDMDAIMKDTFKNEDRASKLTSSIMSYRTDDIKDKLKTKMFKGSVN